MKELSRKKIFPIYTDKLRMKFLNKELAKGKAILSEGLYNDYALEKKQIQSVNYHHGTCFKNFIQAFMTGRSDMVDSVLELVEAHYTPRVK